MEIPEQVPQKDGRSFFQRHYYDFWLILSSVFQMERKPWHTSLSLAVGVFLACTPFYGLQTFLIVVFCVIFRLSFPVAFLGSQVSIPPLYSLLVPLQVWIGFSVLGKEFRLSGNWKELAGEHFGVWLVGSLIVGGALAILLGRILLPIHEKNKEDCSELDGFHAWRELG